ncbi:MAG TPA: DUF1634 domain-containing protein [Vicinamibacterales bacterium]
MTDTPDSTSSRALDMLNRGAVLASMGLLGMGLLIWFIVSPASAEGILHVGLIVLMATPALRLITTIAADLARRDWLSLASTLAVSVILGVTVWLSLGA